MLRAVAPILALSVVPKNNNNDNSIVKYNTIYYTSLLNDILLYDILLYDILYNYIKSTINILLYDILLIII